MKHFISLLILLGLSQGCFANGNQTTYFTQDEADKLNEMYNDGEIQDHRQSKPIFQEIKTAVASKIDVTDEQITRDPSYGEDGAKQEYWNDVLSDTQNESFEKIKSNYGRDKTGEPCRNDEMCALRKYMR